MKPTDRTLGSFDQKIAQAIPKAGFSDLSPHEVAAVKERIRFVLFDSNPADLTVAQISDWIRRVVPGIRRSTAVLANHDRIADGVASTDQLVQAGFSPKPVAVQAAGESLAAGEVYCSLVGPRKVRYNPTSLVVTPMKVEKT